MRKIILFAIVFGLITSFTSCEEDFEPGGTAVEELSGRWNVLYNHSVYGEDAFGAGKTEILTYNTADNSSSDIWLSDEANFWDYKVRIPVDLQNLTFGTEDTVVNAVTGYEIKILVRNGKIMEDAATPPSGLPVDSIYFELWFEDLEGSTGIANDTLFVSGYRYTGWEEDN
jgi:hypothetical protein